MDMEDAGLFEGAGITVDTDSINEPPLMSEETRIVLFGKTGVGKSSTGNTIIGRSEFPVAFSAQSITKECIKIKAEVDGRQVAVLDTPGLFDTDLTEDTVISRLIDCITLSCPGPHVFLLVFTLASFTEEDKQTVQKLQAIFGEEATRYTIIAFTGGDRLKEQTIEKYLAEAGDDLNQMLESCGRRHVVFNNENMEDRSQVTRLMGMINEIKVNNGTCYTNEMYESVERAIQEREEELRDEMGEEMRAMQMEMHKLHLKYSRQILTINQKYKEIFRQCAEREIKKKQFPFKKKVIKHCVQQ